MPVRINGSTSGYVELAAPAVASNATITLPDTSATLANTSQVGVGKNRIINGGFDVNQRAFTNVTADGAYSFDRWRNGVYGGTMTTTPQTFTLGNVIPGYEPKNYVQIVTASHTANDAVATYVQSIEGVRTFAGQTVTVSFWAKAASGTPKIAAELRQDFGSGGSASSAVNTYAGQATVSTSWARYSVTVAVPSISGKVIGTSNTDALILQLWLSGGSNYNSRTGSIGNQNNTFSIWGVQVEAGSGATPFEFESFGDTLRKCQRYYEKSYNVDVAPGTNTTVGAYLDGKSTENNGVAYAQIFLKVPKRSNSFTVKTYANAGTADVWNYGRNGAAGTYATQINYNGIAGFSVAVLSYQPWIVMYVAGHWTCDAEL